MQIITQVIIRSRVVFHPKQNRTVDPDLDISHANLSRRHDYRTWIMYKFIKKQKLSVFFCYKN